MKTMKDDCWLKPGLIRAEFEAFFSEMDKRLSMYYEENPNMREEHIEGRLVTLLDDDHFTVYRNRINQMRQARGQSLLTMEFKHITNKEGNHGADIGLVARLNMPGEIVNTKAALIQSKRLHPRLSVFTESCDYPELFTHGDTTPSQWQRMLAVSLASAYFLYNPDKVKVGNSFKSVGTRVISAQNIRSMANGGRRKLSVGDFFNDNESISSRSISSWMVNQFICCDVGDPNPNTIKIAMGGSSEFSVRHSIQITIERTNMIPGLFVR